MYKKSLILKYAIGFLFVSAIIYTVNLQKTFYIDAFLKKKSQNFQKNYEAMLEDTYRHIDKIG